LLKFLLPFLPHLLTGTAAKARHHTAPIQSATTKAPNVTANHRTPPFLKSLWPVLPRLTVFPVFSRPLKPSMPGRRERDSASLPRVISPRRRGHFPIAPLRAGAAQNSSPSHTRFALSERILRPARGLPWHGGRSTRPHTVGTLSGFGARPGSRFPLPPRQRERSD
jgi:hypothetical protein